MTFSIIPLQAMQNNRSDRRQQPPGKQPATGDFAAVLKSYAGGVNGVRRQDGFTPKGKGQPQQRRLPQSDIDQLWRQVHRVNSVISALLE